MIQGQGKSPDKNGKSKYDFDPSDLTQESNLWNIYWLSLKLPVSWFNLISTWILLGTLVVHMLLSEKTTSIMAEEVRSLVDTGFNFASSILGFLIAGFTIFATLNKPDLFMTMAKIKEDKTGLSYLKYNFFTFMKVFIHYVSFITICLLIKLLASPSGTLSVSIDFLSIYIDLLKPAAIKHTIVVIGFALLGAWFFYLIMLLKSFIFNVYHIVMTSVRWEFESNTSDE
jgi:hypothetical protein